MRSRPLPRLILAAAGLLIAVPLLWACAPYLPNWLLGSDETLFAGFTGKFESELDRLQPSYMRPPFRAVPSREGHVADVLAAEREELGLAMERDDTWTMERLKIMDDLERLREDLAQRRTAREAYLHGTKPGRPVPSGLTVPESLPPEFADYLEGALAWYEGRSDAAVQAWEKLLRRPPDERRYRSTWAAFMIGRTLLGSQPDRAVKSFQLTRDLAAEGYFDRLGLAASSLGWEAYLELGRQRYAQASFSTRSRSGPAIPAPGSP